MCASGWCEFWFYGDHVPFASIDEARSALARDFEVSGTGDEESFQVRLPSGYLTVVGYWEPEPSEPELRISIGDGSGRTKKIDVLPLLLWMSRLDGVDVDCHMESKTVACFEVGTKDVHEYIWGIPVCGGMYYRVQDDPPSIELRKGDLVTFRSTPRGSGNALYCGIRRWDVRMSYA